MPLGWVFFFLQIHGGTETHGRVQPDSPGQLQRLRRHAEPSHDQGQRRRGSAPGSQQGDVHWR